MQIHFPALLYCLSLYFHSFFWWPFDRSLICLFPKQNRRWTWGRATLVWVRSTRRPSKRLRESSGVSSPRRTVPLSSSDLRESHSRCYRVWLIIHVFLCVFEFDFECARADGTLLGHSMLRRRPVVHLEPLSNQPSLLTVPIMVSTSLLGCWSPSKSSSLSSATLTSTRYLNNVLYDFSYTYFHLLWFWTYFSGFTN